MKVDQYPSVFLDMLDLQFYNHMCNYVLQRVNVRYKTVFHIYTYTRIHRASFYNVHSD